MCRLMIADADSLFTAALRRALQSYPELDLVGIAADGVSALKLAKKTRPDLLLAELLLPKMDGLSLLKEVRNLQNPPMVICISNFYSLSCIEAMRRYGASYYLFKPIKLPNLIFNLREYATLIQQKNQYAQGDDRLCKSDRHEKTVARTMRDM